MYLMNDVGCRSVFCFDLALFSATQIGLHTGCQTFPCGIIKSVKELDNTRFR